MPRLHGDGAASTLFGHVKGAFTGAASDRPGLLRSAHKGLLFLDDIGELGPDEQAMLLKAVEEKRFLPMGSDNVDRPEDIEPNLAYFLARFSEENQQKGRFNREARECDMRFAIETRV